MTRVREISSVIGVLLGAGLWLAADSAFAASFDCAKAKAAGAPVEVDISKLEPGQLIRVEWRGKPVWVVKRTKQTLDALAAHDGQLRDPASDEPQQPDYAHNGYRSIKPEIFGVGGQNRRIRVEGNCRQRRPLERL